MYYYEVKNPFGDWSPRTSADRPITNKPEKGSDEWIRRIRVLKPHEEHLRLEELHAIAEIMAEAEEQFVKEPVFTSVRGKTEIAPMGNGAGNPQPTASESGGFKD